MVIKDPNFEFYTTHNSQENRFSFSIRDVLLVLFRRKRIVFSLIFLSFFASISYFVFYGYSPKFYLVSKRVKLRFKDEFVAKLSGQSKVSSRTADKQAFIYENYILPIQNLTILSQIVEECELYSEEERLETEAASEDPGQRITSKVYEWLNISQVEDRFEKEERLRAAALRRLRGSISASMERGSTKILVITYEATNKDKAESVIQSLLEGYKKELEQDAEAEEILVEAKESFEEANKALVLAEEKLQDFLKDEGLKSFEFDNWLDRQQALEATMQQDLIAIKIGVEEAGYQMQAAKEKLELEAKLRKEGVVVPLAPTAEGRLLATLEGKIFDVQIDLDMEEGSSEPNNRKIEDFKAQLAALKARKEATQIIVDKQEAEGVDSTSFVDPQMAYAELALDHARQAHERKKGVLKAEQEKLAAFSEKLAATTEAISLSGEGLKEVYVAAFATEERAAALFNELKTRKKYSGAVSPFEADSYDIAISGVLKSRRSAILLLGGIFGGIVAALGLAVLRDVLDASFKSVEEAEAQLGIPVIASIPSDRRTFRKQLRLR